MCGRRLSTKMFFLVSTLLTLLIFVKTGDASDGKLQAYIKQLRKENRDTHLQLTGWKPGRGVKLLDDKAARQVWNHYEEACEASHIENCWMPSLSKVDGSSVITYFVFETRHHHLLAYTILNQHGPNLNWFIAHKHFPHRIIDSMQYEAGYDYDDPSLPSSHGSCGASTTLIRFRELTKKGPFFLEVVLERCQTHSNRHELLFHLDSETLVEVENSRMDMDYSIHPTRSWRWFYEGEHYQPREYEWNERGEAKWTRRLYKYLEGEWGRYYSGVLVERQCQYSQEKKAVICHETLLKQAILEDYDNYMRNMDKVCSHEKTPCTKSHEEIVEELRSIGFVINEKDIERYIRFAGEYENSPWVKRSVQTQNDFHIPLGKCRTIIVREFSAPHHIIDVMSLPEDCRLTTAHLIQKQLEDSSVAAHRE